MAATTVTCWYFYLVSNSNHFAMLRETVSEVQLSDQISAQKGVRELARHAFCSEWPGFTVVV